MPRFVASQKSQLLIWGVWSSSAILFWIKLCRSNFKWSKLTYHMISMLTKKSNRKNVPCVCTKKMNFLIQVNEIVIICKKIISSRSLSGNYTLINCYKMEYDKTWIQISTATDAKPAEKHFMKQNRGTLNSHKSP